MTVIRHWLLKKIAGKDLVLLNVNLQLAKALEIPSGCRVFGGNTLLTL